MGDRGEAPTYMNAADLADLKGRLPNCNRLYFHIGRPIQKRNVVEADATKAAICAAPLGVRRETVRPRHLSRKVEDPGRMSLSATTGSRWRALFPPLIPNFVDRNLSQSGGSGGTWRRSGG